MNDSVGTIKDKYYYYAFGGDRSSTPTTNQPRKYTRKPFGDENGLDLGCSWRPMSLRINPRLHPKNPSFTEIVEFAHPDFLTIF